MTVKTTTDKVVAGARRRWSRLLMADHPVALRAPAASGDCELETLARQAAGVASRASHSALSPRGQDDSSLVIAVDHEACILCDRCIRGCDEIRNNLVLGRRGKGFRRASPSTSTTRWANSTCVSCGECMVSCPTGALTNKRVVGTELGSGELLDADTSCCSSRSSRTSPARSSN